jgi:hypothetical protein
MIIVISKKDFEKNAKKLVEKKEYLICDGTDGESGSFTKYARVVSMDGFNPPAKLIKVKLSDDGYDEIDSTKLKKLEKKYFKGKDFKTCVMACVKDIVTTDDAHNIFVVVTNKAYKTYAKKMIKSMEKLMDADFQFAYLYDDVKADKSLLKHTLKSSKVKALGKVIEKYEEKNS